MNLNKFLYEFTVNKEEEVEKSEISKNEKNEEIRIVKKEIIKNPISVRIIKPDRKLFDDAELFYGVQLSEGIKSGLLTRSLLAKRYQNDGGALSDPEKEQYANLYIKLFQIESDTQRVQVNLNNLSSDEKNEKIKELLLEAAEVRKKLQEFELYQSSLFDQTAENRARNKTIMWWVLHLSYIKYKEDYTSLFGEGDFSLRLNKYDEIEENDSDFEKEVVKRCAYFTSLWYIGRAITPEDFKSFEKALLNEPEENGLIKSSENQKEDTQNDPGKS